MKIVFIADFFANQVAGGGELNNEEFINICVEKGHDVEKINSHLVTVEYLENNLDCNFVVANFVNLPQPCVDFLTKSAKYVIYEHDHKYLKNRNPAIFRNFLAPEKMIIHLSFYANAIAVLCQSNFHKGIVERNLQLENIVNLGGNLWSLESIRKMREFCLESKEDKCSILDSNVGHKNTVGAIEYCKSNNLEYELIKSSDYLDFLKQLSGNKTFVFLPKTPETLSRVAVEARMMSVSVITTNIIGATHEPWFELKGEELIDRIESMREEITEKVVDLLQ